jgi:hypothetical protein
MRKDESILFMPITVFGTKGIPANRRERIEAGVEARRKKCFVAARNLDRRRSVSRRRPSGDYWPTSF